MEKTLFLNSVTALDCAVLLSGEGARGRSWFVDLTIVGTPDAEGILVDFGTARRIAKSTIDAALDHRLLVRETMVNPIEGGRFLVSSPWKVGDTSGTFILNSYRGSLAFFSQDSLPVASNSGFEVAVARRIEEQLRTELSKNVKRVSIRLRSPDAKRSQHFSYTHSLRHHCGNCQRFHGHSNIVEVLSHGIPDDILATQAAQALDGVYFVAKDYVISQPQGPLFAPILAELDRLGAPREAQAFIQYRGSQGEVALTLPQAALRETPAESTIENLADFIRLQVFGNREDLEVIAYEGLQKGAHSS